jgi:hypothetical protein
MSVQERIKRYKTTGAGAGLTRVEVLVPPEGRGQVVTLAKRLRDEHRWAKAFRAVNAEQVNDRAKLMIHRLVARRMATDPGLIGRAREALSKASAAGDAHTYMDEWRDLLAHDPAELRRLITARSAEMTRLRLSSPFALLAGVEDLELRRRIWRMARLGLVSHGG